MNNGKLTKVGAVFLGLMFSIFGLWGIFAEEYSNERSLLRRGLNAKGEDAVIIGSVVLAFGLYILYLVLTAKK